jgi:hypothetical protein
MHKYKFVTMKTISTFFLLILSLVSLAQNTDKYFYDLKTKTFRIADNSVDEQGAINNVSILSEHWAVNRNLNIIGSNPTLNPDILSSSDGIAISESSYDISKYPWLSSKAIDEPLLCSSGAIFSFGSNSFAENNEQNAFKFAIAYREGLNIDHSPISENGFLYALDSLTKNPLSQKVHFANNSTSEDNTYILFGTPNFSVYAGSIQDSSLILFSSFTNIGKAIYKNRNEIVSFKFNENMLMDNQGNSLSLRTTNFSNSITSLYSAAPGNGGIVTERGIYQTEWKGSDDVSYAILQASSPVQSASFTLNPSANVSNNNQEGYFIIKPSDDNSFVLGTINSSTALVGFRNTAGTVLTLKADVIETTGVFSTSGLTVFDSDKDKLNHTENALAYFVSNNSDGTNIQIINGSSSVNAFAGVTFTQGNISNRIATYSNSNGPSYLNDAFGFESNSPSGMVFAVNSNLNVEQGRIRFMFDSKASVTITAKSISIANALLLQGITEEEMDKFDPQEGTIINNTDRKKLLYNDGKEWFEIQMKPIRPLMN